MSDEPLIIQPNRKQVIQPMVKTATIGGVPLDYQPDPALAVTIDPQVLQHPNAMLGLLSAMINVQHALVRELLASADALEGLGSEVVSLREQVDRMAAAFLPSTGVDSAVESPGAPTADAEVG